MGSRFDDIVIDNKNAKLKTFLIRSGIGMFISILFIGFIAFAVAVSDIKKLTDNIDDVAMIGVIAAVVSLCIGAWYAFKTKNVCVKISRNQVDVTVNKAHGVYPLEDYNGFKLSKNASGKELVFANGDDPDNSLYIALPVNLKQFIRISDAIQIAKLETYGGYEQRDAYKDDVYKRTPGPDSYKGVIAALIIGMAIDIFLAAFFVLKGFDNPRRIVIFYLCVLFFLVLFMIFICILVIKIQNKKRSVRTIEFGDRALIINDMDFSYIDIERICMTPPYLHHFSAHHRKLSLKLFDSEKPLIFYVGNRPDDEYQEDSSEGCSCSYPELYARVKSDRNLESKFAWF